MLFTEASAKGISCGVLEADLIMKVGEDPGLKTAL